MESLRLLIIEDEKRQLQMYCDAIDQFNKTSEIKIDSEICNNFKDGESALKTPLFDAAIIDLKLSNSEDLEGRTLVESVYKKIRIPIFIVSGSIAQIDDIPENALLKKKLRTDYVKEILVEILSIYKTGITSFLKPGGTIDKHLSSIFWNNLSKDISLWIEHNNEKTLLRYILSHFQEYLELNGEGDFEEYHQQEIYLTPPIKKNLHTGDLIKIENTFYLVLTPACDIVYHSKKDSDGNNIQIRKADKMLLATVKNFDFKDHCVDKNQVIKKDKIREFVTNHSFRFHYLPPFKNENGYLIDFQDLTSKPFDISYSREASISAPFIKDIISRFSSYYSRQGQPTFNQQVIIDKLFELSRSA
jgi:hypothetical protein